MRSARGMQDESAADLERGEPTILCTLRFPTGRNLLSAAIYRMGASLVLFTWWGRNPPRPRVAVLAGPAPSQTAAGKWAW